MVSWFIGLVANTENQFAYGLHRSFAKGCGGYEVSLAGHLPISETPLMWSKDAAYLIQVGAKKPGAAPVRLDINPACLTPKGMSHLHETMLAHFCLDPGLFAKARVSRVDAAVDISSVRACDWVWDLPSIKARQIFTMNGELQTLYLGNTRGKPLVVYDKKQQAGLVGPEVTRVEFRLKNAGRFEDLSNLPNPLIPLLVMNPSKVDHPFGEAMKLSLLSAGQMGGRKAILSMFPKGMRKDLSTKLLQTTPPWWQPKNIWEAWPKLVSDAVSCLAFGL